MGDDLTIGSIVMDNNSYAVVTANNTLSPIMDGTMLTSVGSISNTISIHDEDPLDKFAMNRFTIDHKVSAQELLKLQEVAPDFAKEIKENIAKNLSREISNKVSYTKKHDKDTDVHHFIGRVWVFTEDELKSLLGMK
jgi:hypothetical protein